jgi:hypothetical protein
MNHHAKLHMKCASSTRNSEAAMMLSQIPSPHKKHDTQMLPEAKQETWSQPVFVPSPKDRMIVAIISLVVLVFCAVLMFGATTVLHAGIMGWLATLTLILIAVVTINVLLALCHSQQKL